MNNSKSIFITGAAGGMGRSTAKLFLNKNWFVGCYDNNKENLLELEDELGNKNIIYEVLDVTNKENFSRMCKQFFIKIWRETRYTFQQCRNYSRGVF